MTPEKQASSPGLVSVIVPTLNEGQNIDPLLRDLFAVDSLAGRLEVVIADDGSTDGTVERVGEWSNTHPVRLLERTGKPDLAAAVIEAARDCRGRWVVVMDADGSHPVDRIPALLEPLETGACEIAVGSRHVAGGSIDDWPWYRWAMSRFAALLAWPFTELEDPLSGFFATDRDRIASLPAEPGGYKILLELVVRDHPRPRVAEIPIRFQDRAFGQSKLGFRTQWVFLQRLAAMGGARLSVGNASKFGLVGLSGMLVDLAVFQVLVFGGIGLAGAHMSSFAVATLTNFTLNYKWTFRGAFASDQPVAMRYMRFLAVAMLSLMLRGGMLAALVHGIGMAPALAIVPAVVITAAINYLGSIFYVFPTPEAATRVRIRWHLAALGLIAYIYALRLLYLGQVDLILDEMYYWTYNLYPALSYLDHPPLSAWLIRLGTALAGDGTFGVRLPLLVLSPLAAWFAYLYGRDMIDRSAGLLAALLVFTIPAYFAAGMLITPDAALIASWSAALYFFQRSLIQGERRAFLGLGLAMGAGLLAKYTMVLLAPAAFVFMLFDTRARRWFMRPQPYLAALLSAVMFLPVLVWNWQHDWASFAFQATRRLIEHPGFTTHMIVVFTALMFAPLAAPAAGYVFGPVRKQLAGIDRHRRFMLTMTLVPLAIFTAYSMFSPVKFHWAIAVWLGILPLIAATVLPRSESAERPFLRLLNRFWGPALVFKAIVFGLVLHYIALGLPGVPWSDGRLGYLGWKEMAEAVHELEQQVEADTGMRPLIAGMAKWSVAAALTFHDADGRRDNITSRNLVGMRGSQWEYWFDPETDPSRPVILVNHSPKLIDESWLEQALVGLGPLMTRPVYREGRHIQTLYYRIAEGFRPEQVRYPDRWPEAPDPEPPD